MKFLVMLEFKPMLFMAWIVRPQLVLLHQKSGTYIENVAFTYFFQMTKTYNLTRGSHLNKTLMKYLELQKNILPLFHNSCSCLHN